MISWSTAAVSFSTPIHDHVLLFTMQMAVWQYADPRRDSHFLWVSFSFSGVCDSLCCHYTIVLHLDILKYWNKNCNSTFHLKTAAIQFQCLSNICWYEWVASGNCKRLKLSKLTFTLLLAIGRPFESQNTPIATQWLLNDCPLSNVLLLLWLRICRNRDPPLGVRHYYTPVGRRGEQEMWDECRGLLGWPWLHTRNATMG